jgi:defect in organelle trafficking protein DotC
MAADIPMNLEEVQAYYDRPAIVRSANDSSGASATAKIEALKEAALGIGVKAGLRKQLGHINAVINGKSRELDTIYDFGNLMIKDRVVPAVITEARDLYNQDGAYALRLSGAYYRIEQQPRFSSVPPNWREYLVFGKFETPEEPFFGSISPKNDAEREIWREHIAKGWGQGVDQANVMLQYGLDRLNRDLTGMIRFHTFVLQNKITMPAIASQTWSYSAQHSEAIAVDETLLRITTLPEFNSSIEKWRASIKTSEITLPTPAQPTDAMRRISPRFDPATVEDSKPTMIKGSEAAQDGGPRG